MEMRNMKRLLVFGVLAILLLAVVFVFYFMWPRFMWARQGGETGTVANGKVITVEDLRVEMERLREINSYPSNEGIDPEDYPVVLGKYSENGLPLVEKYYCSDVCPANGRVVIVFQNITSKEECAKVGGEDLIDPAWGGYIGCAPRID